MISKLVAWAEDRPLAIARMRRALGEYLVAGIKTTLPFFTWLLDAAGFLGRPVSHDVSRRAAEGAERPAVRRADGGGRRDRGDGRRAPGRAVRAGPPSGDATERDPSAQGYWKAQAREEGLR